MPLLTAKKPATVQPPSPDGIILHNIEVWRSLGYGDDYIARCMMSPRLSKPEEYSRWGLKYPVRKGPIARKRKKPKPTVAKKHGRQRGATLEQVLAAVRGALAKPDPCPLKVIASELKTSSKMLTIYRKESTELDQACQLLAERNKVVGADASIQARKEKVAGAFERANAILDAAIADGVPLTAPGISLRLGYNKSWLYARVKLGDPQALKLKARIDDRNNKLKGK